MRRAFGWGETTLDDDDHHHDHDHDVCNSSYSLGLTHLLVSLSIIPSGRRWSGHEQALKKTTGASQKMENSSTSKMQNPMSIFLP